MILIMGDMNRTIRSGQYGVKGNKEQISTRGELIREQLIKTGEYVLTNNLPLAVGGPFPWVHPGKERVKSCLDLALASANLTPFVKTMLIDKEKNFTPRRMIRRAGKAETIFTDHFYVELIIEGLPRSNKGIEK